ncbi:ABC transporter transmembrane domain-containing protein [Weissella paramesenteroides]|uniref:ABC transporter ATP-binding protein n=1 Tax=Weissella paramesenteroides TaxID=1249 RepID=UPI001127FAFD|nr:ABC transporter transmembrane domain-containing protein [Weissella paramesenteroides]MCS9983814.1 ATP-binding cassette domain-containing protein [Weissella paramesenteroides]MCS9997535.1 ATP-binding cassette domain-containing protein [Weissella paramesenteroides]MCT0259947.1 ATP-binding cassette domain-containing protein [Weissella paramesenteroides]MCT0484446.1 ATP-binding cassette domain-containing protein [Weissella paramesenteroides]NEZ89718.1 ATP-binding cassette domain-containing prot
MSIFIKLSWYFKQEWRIYAIGVLGLVLTAIFGIFPPWIIGHLVDLIRDEKLTADYLFLLLGGLVAVAIIQYIARYMWRNAIWGEAAKLESLLRHRIFWHYMQMDTAFFQRYRTGDLMAHATNDLSAIQRVAGGGILQFADSLITGGTTLIAMMLVVDWRLTLIAILPLPLLAVMARTLGNKMHIAFKKSQAAFSRLNNKAQESISGVKVIKSFGQEAADIQDFNQQIDDTITINQHVNKLDALFDPITTMIMAISYVVTIIYGGHLVNTSVITLGALVSFVSYLSMLVWPMFALGMLFNTLERGNASYDRIEAIMAEKSSIIEPEDAVNKTPVGNVDYQVASFTFPGATAPALTNINFNISAGKTLGLVGSVGSGKSTIIRLLLREFDNYQGAITFNTLDIRQYQLDAYMPAIGYVPQETYLFSDTVRENIRFARPNATQAEVEEAAYKSDLAEQVDNMPEGYDTPVGEEGISLSGGQRQRLAIARALLIDPELLILDDALSAVDAETETAILQTLRQERQNKTTIIASHRLSSVMDADEILVMQDGQIIERGTHDSLISQNGWYAKTFALQALAVEGEV